MKITFFVDNDKENKVYVPYFFYNDKFQIW